MRRCKARSGVEFAIPTALTLTPAARMSSVHPFHPTPAHRYGFCGACSGGGGISHTLSLSSEWRNQNKTHKQTPPPHKPPICGSTKFRFAVASFYEVGLEKILNPLSPALNILQTRIVWEYLESIVFFIIIMYVSTY